MSGETDITLTFSAQELASLVAALVDASINDPALANAYEWAALEARLNTVLGTWRRENTPARGGAR